jgi:hypothetical protein
MTSNAFVELRMNKREDPEFCYACLVNPNSNFEKNLWKMAVLLKYLRSDYYSVGHSMQLKNAYIKMEQQNWQLCIAMVTFLPWMSGSHGL